MKTWKMPRIDVEAFAANEHVAACSHSGNTWTLGCEYVSGSEYDFLPQHQSAAEVGGVCPHYSIQISDTQFGQISGSYLYMGSNGEYVSRYTPKNDQYVGDYLYRVFTATHSNKKYILFTVYDWVPGSASTSGYYREDINQQNHRLGLGPNSNPES